MTDNIPEPITPEEMVVDMPADPDGPSDVDIEGEDYTEPLLDDDNDDDVVGELDDAAAGGEDA